jgi:hypothetical protein
VKRDEKLLLLSGVVAIVVLAMTKWLPVVALAALVTTWIITLVLVADLSKQHRDRKDD